MKRKVVTWLILVAVIISTVEMGTYNSYATEVASSTDASTEVTSTETDADRTDIVTSSMVTASGEAEGVTLINFDNYYYYGERGYVQISFLNSTDKSYTISDYKGYYLFEDGTTKELSGHFLENISVIDSIVGKEVKPYDEEAGYSGCDYSFQTDFIPYKYMGANIIVEIDIQDEAGNTYSYYWDSGEVIERVDLYEYEIKTDDVISAGATVTYNISITNMVDEQIVLRQIAFDYFSDTTDDSTWELLTCDVKYEDGTYPVYDNGEVCKDGYAPVRLEAGETKNFIVTCTIPDSYSLKSNLRMYSWAMIPNGEFQTKTHSFLTSRMSCEELTDLVAGKEAKVRMYITSSVDSNIDNIILNFHERFSWNASEYDNPTSQIPLTVTDESGNIITDVSEVAVVAGETKILDITFVVPETWTEGSIFNVKASLKDTASNVAVKTYPLVYVEVFENVNVTEGTPAIAIPTDDDNSLGDSVEFSEEEIEKGAKGGKLEVIFKADKVDTEDVASEDMNEIKDVVADKEIVTMVDFTVNKYVNGEHKGKVGKLRKKIKITIDVPEEFRNDKHKFVIIRMHDGVATELADLDDNPNTVTFMTDEFSLYTMAYSEVTEDVEDTTTQSKDTTTTEDIKDKSPATGDIDILAVFVLMTLSGLIALIIRQKKLN